MPSANSSVVLPSIHEMFPDYLMVPSSSHPPSMPPRDHHHHSEPAVPQRTHGASPHLSSSDRHYRERARAASDAPSHASRPVYTPSNAHRSPDVASPISPSRSLQTTSPLVAFHDSKPVKHGDQPDYSFDVLRSDPSSSSLQHIASSATFPNRGTTSSGYNPHGEVSTGMAPAFRVSVSDPPTHSRTTPAPRRARSSTGHARGSKSLEPVASTPIPPAPGYPSIISFPVTTQPERGDSPHADSAEGDDASDGDLSSSNGKKHVCTTCTKRFNRPSSLKIHINTHTGVTPFSCPWPNCGREFNVNSNMRRHYRNHTSPGFSRPHPNEARRRRKRQQSQELVFVSSTGSPASNAVNKAHAAKHASSATPSLSYQAPPPRLEESDDNMSEGEYAEDEMDDLDSRMDVEPASRHLRRGEDVHSRSPPSYHRPSTHYSQSHLRSARESSSMVSTPSSSEDSCPPPSLRSSGWEQRPPSPITKSRDHIYSPSAPYVHSLRDTRVSTALRPAFRS